MYRRMSIIALSLLVILAMGIGACQTQPATPAEITSEITTQSATAKPTSTKLAVLMVVTRAISNEPKTLDSQLASGSTEANLLPLIYDTLVYRTMDNTYKPFLAESWEISEDGTEITFTLREGVTFHDGTPLTADAVKFTFERFGEKGSSRSPLTSELKLIDSIEEVSDRVVRFNFERPSATFFSAISQPFAAILNPTAVEAAGEDYGRHPVGTGPFILDEWQTGQSLTFLPNPDYAWGPPDVSNPGSPFIDKLVMKIIPEAASQVASLQAGEIDLTYINLPDQVHALEADLDISIIDTNASGLYYLAFNTQKPPLDQLKVRQALSHLVNKDEIIEVAFDGLAQTVYTLLPPNLPGAAPELEAYELQYDPDQAGKLLEEAGYTAGPDHMLDGEGNPLELTLITSGRAVNTAMATLLEAQFRAVGVALDIRQMEVAAVIEAANKGEQDLLLWKYDWNDPDTLSKWFTTDRIGAGNRAFYSNPVVDELLDQGQVEMDQSKRIPLYVEAQKLILQDAVWQPLATPLGKIAVRKEIKNLHVVSQGRVLYNDVMVER